MKSIIIALIIGVVCGGATFLIQKYWPAEGGDSMSPLTTGAVSFISAFGALFVTSRKKTP